MSASASFLSYLFSGIGWFAFCYAYISLGEHFIHKRLMHSKCLPESFYKAVPYMYEAYAAHAVRHHAHWYREFDYEPDPVGREENIPIPMKESMLMLLVAFPLWAPIFYFSVFGGCIFVITSILHNRLWSILHRQMHIPENVFFKDWALFHFVARHHFMHHQDTRRNFNVAFPLADFLLGKVAKPKFKDIREMLRLGYLKPHSSLAQMRLKKWREAVEAKRLPALPAVA